MLLELARQKKGKTLQGFADRCKSVTQKTVVKVEDPVLQKFLYEHAASKIYGKKDRDPGTPRKVCQSHQLAGSIKNCCNCRTERITSEQK
jgi:hypothetical protein